MLSFAVFDENGPATSWGVDQAHLVGPDEIPVPAHLRFERGLVICEKHSAEAAGISVVFEARAAETGADPVPLVLHTCLLPERDEPYLLSLELARHRLMTFLNKLEDWGLSDLPTDNAVMVLFESARGAFTKALVSQRSAGAPTDGGAFSVEADRLAREALRLAIDASDALVALDASRALAARLSGFGYERARRVAGLNEGAGPVPVKAPTGVGMVLPGKPLVAAGVRPSAFSPALAQVVSQSSDFLALPMRWIEMEPDEGKYAFGATDRWIEWAVRQSKLPVVAGPIIDFSPASVPEWLYIWEHDYETLREVVYEHVRHVVTRYRRTVPRWTVASGLHTNANFVLSFEQMMDLTRMCVLLVRKLHPASKVQLEVVQPFAGVAGRAPRSVPGVLYSEMLAQSGVTVDAITVRLELARPRPGKIGRDLMTLSAIMDRYAMLDRPVTVVASGPVRTAPDAPDRDEEQAEWIDRALSLILAKPALHSLVWTEQETAPGPRGGAIPAGPITTEGTPTRTVRKLAEMRRVAREEHARPATHP